MAGEAFLTALAVNSNVASSTRNHAANTMALLYGQILRKGLGLLVGVQRARKPARRPIVFTRDEERSVLARLDNVSRSVVRSVSNSSFLVPSWQFTPATSSIQPIHQAPECLMTAV